MWNIHLTRILVGALAGFTAALVKYISHDHSHVMQLLEMEQQSKVPTLLIGYSVGAIILLILGAVAAWISAENDIRKMFFIGLSAPSLFAAGVPPASQPSIIGTTSAKPSWIIEQIITPAYGQGSVPTECIGDGAFVKGFKLFFGQREQIAGYDVVVGSYRDPKQALAKATAINAEDASFKAHVGPRRCDNDFYPVLVGGVSSLEEAKKLAAKAKTLNSIEDAFVSPVPLY